MAPTKWKNKKKKKVVVTESPTKTPTPPSVMVPSIGPNLQESRTTNDTDYTQLTKTKKPKENSACCYFFYRINDIKSDFNYR
jgi:hypothetical protein